MASTRSSRKAIRQNQKCRERNRAQRSTLRTVIKKCRVAAVGDSPEAAETAFRLAVKRIDQAAAKHLIHKNKAARTKSRLANLLAKPAATGG